MAASSISNILIHGIGDFAIVVMQLELKFKLLLGDQVVYLDERVLVECLVFL